MLRRNFLATAGLTITAWLAMGRMPILADMPDKDRTDRGCRKMLHLKGHARSGCATRPELAHLFENGIYNLPG
jgi:hypothetical protein